MTERRVHVDVAGTSCMNCADTATGALEAVDVTLVRDDPMDVLKAIRVSDESLAKIKQNLFWTLEYNTAMIPSPRSDSSDPNS
jgi:cation transport ATPase